MTRHIDNGPSVRLTHEHQLMPWPEVARRLAKLEGRRPVTGARVQQIAQRALAKMRERMEEPS